MSEAVLVTGGAGYIGSHVCKALSRMGYLPVTMDNLLLGHQSFVRWGPLVHADVRDSGAVACAIRDYSIDSVVHLAAFAYVGESVVNPSKYYNNNVVGILGLLEGMRAAGCSRIVFSSTCSVYGEPPTIPISESLPPRPVNPYGRSKLMCEEILRDFSSAYQMRHVALRYFNASGADPEGELGELRDPETHLIPRAMMALQGHVDDFQVFGGDFPTPDGTAVRDYIHVIDLAQAHIRALEHLERGGGSDVFNLGLGLGYSVAEVLEAIEKVSLRTLPKVAGPRRPGDPAILVADASKARRSLGFEPLHSDLETIVRTSWLWRLKAHPSDNRSIERSLTSRNQVEQSPSEMPN